MITKLASDCGLPDKIELSATAGGILEEVHLTLWSPMTEAPDGHGSVGGNRLGRVCLKPADAVQLLFEITKALNTINGR